MKTNYIKYFPRKSSTVVRDYKGNILKTHSLGVLDVRINSVQQCADAAIRLRAEYFYSRKEYTKIEFRLTNGVIVCFDDWAKGYRLHKSSKCITFSQKNGRKGYDRANFEKYLFEVMVIFKKEKNKTSKKKDRASTWDPSSGILELTLLEGSGVVSATVRFSS